jgi:hypothetical protein
LGWWLERFRSARKPERARDPRDDVAEVAPSSNTSAALSVDTGTLLRGLRKASWYNETEGFIIGEAFVPDFSPQEPRADKCHEASINWEDDASVEALTNRNPNGAYGCARITVAGVRHVARLQTLASSMEPAIHAERRPVHGNPYHGNLVYRPLPRGRIKMFANALAIDAVYVPPPRK